MYKQLQGFCMYTVKEVLTLEVAPALGCTEPVAIALGSAAANSLITDGRVDHLEIEIDPNLYKNALAVVIPGTEGESGLELAAALGVVSGDASRMLEVLEKINDADIKKAKEMVKEGRVKVKLAKDRRGIFIHSIVKSGETTAESIIENYHNNIVCLKLNGKEVTDSPLIQKTDRNTGELAKLEEWLRSLDMKDLIGLLDQLDDEDFEFLMEGVNANLKLAEYGLKFGSGLGIGLALERCARQGLLARDMAVSARILASAASDARMSGVKLPAMSSAGSGNHGLTAILPIWAVKDYVDLEDDRVVLESIALSHIITAYIKAHTGRLSAVCGCSVAAGAGAAAGVTYLLGGSIHNISMAIVNLIQDLAGVICDGAKAGCSLKLSTAAGTAVSASLFALQGISVQPTDGIVGCSPEQTMKNLGTLSTEGMIDADRTILGIMLAKQFAE